MSCNRGAVLCFNAIRRNCWLYFDRRTTIASYRYIYWPARSKRDEESTFRLPSTETDPWLVGQFILYNWWHMTCFQYQVIFLSGAYKRWVISGYPKKPGHAKKQTNAAINSRHSLHGDHNDWESGTIIDILSFRCQWVLSPRCCKIMHLRSVLNRLISLLAADCNSMYGMHRAMVDGA